MNDTENANPNENANERAIYCPSCGARVAEHAERGDSLKCPVCGTEFLYEPGKSAESSVAESDAAQTPAAKRQSTEEILLERLKHEPPAKKPIRPSAIAILAVAIILIAFAIVKITSHPDTYAPGHDVDTTASLQRRMAFQHVIDSLQTEITKNPGNLDLHLTLADADYDAGLWDSSKHEFEIYLAQKPKDADARVDYSYAVAQATGNLQLAISEIDTALMSQPNHLNALINAGIMTAQTITDTNHATALAKAKDYFVRARAVAAKTNPEVARRIDTLIMAIDSTGMKMRMR